MATAYISSAIGNVTMAAPRGEDQLGFVLDHGGEDGRLLRIGDLRRPGLR